MGAGTPAGQQRGGSSGLCQELKGVGGCVWGVNSEGTDCPHVTSLQPLILALNLEQLPNFAEATVLAG